jgi:hypothetical protein
VQAQDTVPWYIWPFPHKKRIAGNGESCFKLKLGYVLMFNAVSTQPFQARDIAASGGLPYQRTCPLLKDFGWMDFLGVEPTSVGFALFEGLCDLGGGNHLCWRPTWLERRAIPLINYTLAFALQLKKSTENLRQGSRVATGLLVAPTWLSFQGQPRLACLHVSSPRLRGWLQSALDRR